jgi:lipoprotein-anchoring transpeptidase ErfK/SrfK
VYKGKKGSWTRIYAFTCSVGDKENPTPLGSFKIYKKIQKSETTNQSKVKVRCWGLCRFYEDETGRTYSLNSILYRASDGTVYDGRLGANCTSGTVRLSYNNAMWIYYNAPVNTKVYVAA